METEQALIALITADRLHMPVSSIAGKLDRRKKNFLQDIEIGKSDKYNGERCYARVESEDLEKARGMRQGIAEFAKRHPKYGTELNQIIEEKRRKRETHMYFGMNEGCRLAERDYLGIMENIGITQGQARNLYPKLVDLSKKLSNKRDEERRILIG
jgi:hypothetical protein